MTIKKRLAISNLIMIVVPLLITAIIAVSCAGAVYYAIHYSKGVGFSDKEDFYQASQALSTAIDEALEGKPDDVYKKLQTISYALNQETMTLQVDLNSEDFFLCGTHSEYDTSLKDVITSMNEDTFISGGNRQLFHHTAKAGDNIYDVYIFSTPQHTNYSTIETVVTICIIIMVTGVIISVLFTNRFLTRFVLKQIEEPLNLLVKGVEEISNGNLDYRITYYKHDEFLPVSNAFNEMALRLKHSVELTQKNESNRKELLLDISHDLRSPLTSIQAYVEGLLDGVASQPEMQKKYLETIKRKTIEIEKMVSEIFEYSKLDMENVFIDCKELSVSEEISKIVASIQEEYSTRGTEIELYSHTDAKAMLDASLLNRIVTNIVDNSSKYKIKSACKSVIDIREENNYVNVIISDDGPGVNKDTFDKLFEIFYRTDSARTNPGDGNGIGLAFVKNAMSKMGGNVYAGSSEYGGLSITLMFRKKVQ